jgi:phenylacetate-CoA ligase
MSDAPDPRIALVAPFPPPAGGMAVQAEGLARALRGAGWDVKEVATFRPLPARLERVPVLRAAVREAGFLLRLLDALRDADVVHLMACSHLSFLLHAAPTIVFARLLRKGLLVNYRGGLAREFFARSRRWALPLVRRAHRLVVPSGFLEEVFRELGLAAEVIPNFVDLERFRWRERDPLAPRFLVARNLEPLYDVGSAIEAFRQVVAHFPEASLSLAGTGSEEARLSMLVARLSLKRVRFLGAVPPAAMPAVLEEHDIALNPTTADNMPVSVLEAMASGLPVVSTRVGGVPWLVQDGSTGLLVDPRRPDQMAAAALRLLADPDGARAIARRARASIEGSALARVRAAFEERYRALAPRRG